MTHVYVVRFIDSIHNTSEIRGVYTSVKKAYYSIQDLELNWKSSYSTVALNLREENRWWSLISGGIIQIEKASLNVPQVH